MVIGLDEHLFQRKYGTRRFATVVVDFQGKRLFELVDGKAGDELKAALFHIKGRENVRWAVIDLADSYRQFVRSFFSKAQLVADKFHVLRLFSKALNRKRIDITGDRRKYPIRKLLLKNQRDLQLYQQRALKQWLDEHENVAELYRYKEAMHRPYRIKGYHRAQHILNKLLDSMGRSQQAAVLTIRQTLLSWSKEIINYFRTELTNARTEGVNRIAKLVQRQAFGYKSFRNYRLRLLYAYS